MVIASLNTGSWTSYRGITWYTTGERTPNSFVFGMNNYNGSAGLFDIYINWYVCGMAA